MSTRAAVNQMSSLPKRTREHVLEAKSLQFVKSVLPLEWIVRDGKPDYGIDLFVEIVQEGSPTGASFLMQIKATEKANESKRGQCISHRCKTTTLAYFLERPEPIIYVLYDAKVNRAYYLWIQTYIAKGLKRGWRQRQKVTIRIPINQEFDAGAMREIFEHVQARHDRAKWLSATQTVNNPFYEYRFQSADRSFGFSVHPRYPGAVEEQPVALSGTFRFDKSDEGRTAMKALEQALKTGSSAEIDSRFFEGFSLPEAFSDVFTHLGIEEVKLDKISIGSARSDRQLVANLQALNEAGEVIYEFSNLVFRQVQVGTEETTWSNREQGTMPEITLRLNLKRGAGWFSMKMDPHRVNAVQVLRFLEAQKAFAQSACLRLHNPETAISLDLRSQTGSMAAPDESFLSIARELAFIQERTGQVISWPEGFAVPHVQLISSIASALRTGRSSENRSHLTVLTDRAAASSLYVAFKENERLQLRLDTSRIVNLWGTVISLGPVVVVLPSVAPTSTTVALLRGLKDDSNEADSSPSPEEPIAIEVEVGEPGILIYYLDWLPADDLARLHKEGFIEKGSE